MILTLHLYNYPKTHTSPSFICLPASTLQDLLNPASVGEEEPFISDDPYGGTALEDDDNKLDDEPQPACHHTWISIQKAQDF